MTKLPIHESLIIRAIADAAGLYFFFLCVTRLRYFSTTSDATVVAAFVAIAGFVAWIWSWASANRGLRRREPHHDQVWILFVSFALEIFFIVLVALPNLLAVRV